MNYWLFLILLCSLQVPAKCFPKLPTCNYRDFFLTFSSKTATTQCPKRKSIYILYDINAVEGFNLRRDVYIRLAVFIKNLRQKRGFENTKLVLPPYPRLYHWRSDHIDQEGLVWRRFFDLPSMRNYTAILDYDQFLREAGEPDQRLVLDQVYQLQNFKEMFVNGVFTDKFEEKSCRREDHFRKNYFKNPMISEKAFSCLKFQGSAVLLEKVLRKRLKGNISLTMKILFLNAEIVLHDFWGNDEFWRARRSMRFNRVLEGIAADYRLVNFNSTNESERVQRPSDWRDEVPYRDAIGGNYLCGHLRRADFLHGREATTPSLKSVANQITAKLKELRLTKVFIASDCSGFEFQNLKTYLGRMKVYRFKPESIEQKMRILDGGIAIIDQIICSHARHFIGTYESTFSYRIYEEREILGFPKESTFNTFCKNEDLSNCERNSIWQIVY